MDSTAQKLKLKTRAYARGFTLVEIIVSVGIFMMVMLVAIGALTGMAGANRKAQSIQTVVDNINFALDDVSRNIRTGTTYHCVESGSTPSGEAPASLAATGDCATYGSAYVAFESNHGDPLNVNDQIVYWFAPAESCGSGYSAGCIEKSVNSGATFLPLTSPGVQINSLRFYITGSTAGDTLQPKAVIKTLATIPLTPDTQTTMRLQTTVSQRVYDQ